MRSPVPILCILDVTLYYACNIHFMNVLQIDQEHDAGSFTESTLTHIPLQSPIISHIRQVETASNELLYIPNPNITSNSESLPPASNDPAPTDLRTFKTQSSVTFPALRVKIEKLDDEMLLQPSYDEQEQSEALDLRITKSSMNVTIPKAPGCQCHQLSPPDGLDQAFHMNYTPHIPISNTHRRAGGLVPLLVEESVYNTPSDIVFSPFVSVFSCQKVRVWM